MTSPSFQELSLAYHAELSDLMYDSEGHDKLGKRLADKRHELPFLMQMIEVAPEMVAVVFHQGFQFTDPAALERLVGRRTDEVAEWSTLSGSVTLAPWAQPLAAEVLKHPGGERFLTVAAALSYLHGKAASAPGPVSHDDEEDDRDDDAFDDDVNGDDRGEHRPADEEAGAEWMVEQGFDPKNP